MSNKQELKDFELGELRSLQRLIKQEEVKYALVVKNTAMVVKGQEWAKTQEGVIKVLKAYLDEQIFDIAKQRGMQGAVTVDLEQGIIQTV